MELQKYKTWQLTPHDKGVWLARDADGNNIDIFNTSNILKKAKYLNNKFTSDFLYYRLWPSMSKSKFRVFSNMFFGKSNGKKLSKPIINMENNEIYNSVANASKVNGISTTKVYSLLKDGYYEYLSYTF